MNYQIKLKCGVLLKREKMYNSIIVRLLIINRVFGFTAQGYKFTFKCQTVMIAKFKIFAKINSLLKEIVVSY